MTYQELIVELSREATMPRTECKRVLRALSEVLQKKLMAGHEVHIRGLGKMHRGVVAPRGSINGRKAKPANVIYFRMARSLRKKMRDL